MNVLLLAGSPSIPSRSTRLLHHVGERLAVLGHRSSKLHVLDLPAQALLHAEFNNADIKEAKERLQLADAVVVATPVYKAAYSGILKAFLDLLPQDGLAGKLVLPLATGGSQSHMLALDYALRPVLLALGAKHVLPSIYATESQIDWSADNGLILDAGIAQRVSDGIANLSANLVAMRTARAGDFMPVPFSQVPEVVKVDTRQTVHDGPALRLLEKCAEQNVRVIFKRVENAETLDALSRIGAVSGRVIHAQGFLWDLPNASIAPRKPQAQILPLQTVSAPFAKAG